MLYFDEYLKECLWVFFHQAQLVWNFLYNIHINLKEVKRTEYNFQVPFYCPIQTTDALVWYSSLEVASSLGKRTKC